MNPAELVKRVLANTTKRSAFVDVSDDELRTASAAITSELQRRGIPIHDARQQLATILDAMGKRRQSAERM